MNALDRILMATEADQATSAIDSLAELLASKRREFRRLLKQCGDGNVYFFVDEVVDAERLLEKLARKLEALCLSFECDYEAPEEPDYPEDDAQC